jgi:hypothetical protein
VPEAVSAAALSAVPKAFGGAVRLRYGSRSDPSGNVIMGWCVPANGWPGRVPSSASLATAGWRGRGEDFAYVAGWGYVDRALEVAAAGLHNVVRQAAPCLAGTGGPPARFHHVSRARHPLR